MVQEVEDLQNNIHELQRKLADAEASQQQLLKTRARLEHELDVKNNSLFIDREKCLGIRKSFPISTLITHY